VLASDADNRSGATSVTVPRLDPPTRLQCLLCRQIFNKRSGPRDRRDEWGQASGDLDEEGIAELVRIAESVVADERDRGRQLDAKSATLAGFSGLILAIDTALSRSIFGVDLGTVGDVFARGGFMLAAASLLCATALSIAGVLMPQKYRGLGKDAVDDFGGPAFQTMTRCEIHRSLLPSLSQTLAQDRSVNDCKARLTKRVAIFLLVGFVGLTAAAITIAQHSVSGPAKPDSDHGSQSAKPSKKRTK
jgi:hypothetical protein